MLGLRRCCCAPGGDVINCGACPIPAADLTLSWVGIPGFMLDGSSTLAYSPGPATWTSTCQWPWPPGTISAPAWRIKMYCNGFSSIFVEEDFWGATGPDQCLGPPGTCNIVGAGTAAPGWSKSLTCGPGFLFILTRTGSPTCNVGFNSLTISA